MTSVPVNSRNLSAVRLPERVNRVWGAKTKDNIWTKDLEFPSTFSTILLC